MPEQRSGAHPLAEGALPDGGAHPAEAVADASGSAPATEASTAGRAWRPVAELAVRIGLIALVTLTLFAWPAARMAPRDLPIGLAGPEQATTGIARALTASDADAFEIHRYADEAAARAAITEREIYGAVVAGPDGMKLLTASAAGPAVAQALQQGVAQLQAPQGDQGQGQGQPGAPGAVAPLQVEDVVPLPAEDPRGAALASLLLPLSLSGVGAGALAHLGVRGGRGPRIAAVLAAAVTAGLVGVAVVQGWLGALGGNWLVNAGVLALIVTAVGCLVAGLARLWGTAGLAVGAVLVVLIGNPFSGVTSAPELLPEPAGLIGSLLPLGAGASLLRSTSYFDGAGAAVPLEVLLVWSLLGLSLLVVAGNRPATAAAPAGRASSRVEA
ncbi:ABC transporter permease [Allostreptomyces psammosilenae]|uniref:ABC transporter permease n=1 Tax=Allostreptomyces psammosilenae TaxID=1892865 RepID=A0A853ABG4_9ACTN|nr:ABC transporter permease [Allostreptomyces psammosilenae]NYI07712.1 hypothetical protein [Allostreptomyces psammosilenae]